jgi:hypothetical protein
VHARRIQGDLASASWFGMTPSTSQNSLSPDEKLQRHANGQAEAKSP